MNEKNIKLDYCLTTKDGEVMTFEFIHDAERENRGFVIDRLNAYIDDEMVGYLKVEYVGSDRFQDFYPSGIINYLTLIEGSIILPYESKKADLKKAHPELLNAVARNLYSYRFAREMPITLLGSYKEFNTWFREATKENTRLQRVTKGFREFKKRIDKPFVAFICTDESQTNGVPRDNRGRGIATALYKVMAVELAKRGMPLRSSTLQAPEAAGIWEKFEKEGLTYRDKDRLVLDPSKITFENQNISALTF